MTLKNLIYTKLTLNKTILLKRLKQLLLVVYFCFLIFALFNYRSNVIETMPNVILEMSRLDKSDIGRCNLDFDKLGDVEVDIFGDPSEKSILQSNPEIELGGKWKPKDCTAWQKVAIIIPYRDRLHPLHILLDRIHPMLQKQKLDYRVFVIEQAGDLAFNRGKLMNVGYLESLKYDNYDCMVYQDVDLLPEDDRNLYMCDEQARHLAAAINERRYHVMYYNYAGGVIALNKKNFKTINGYANAYWGWGNEDDDFSARILESGLLLTRPPIHIGRYKMVRHTKAKRSEHGNGMFLGWRTRWSMDGLNTISYSVVSKVDTPLYTKITADVGVPPPEMDFYTQDHSGDVSLWWFLKFYFP